jgi:hypothetical protein
MVSLVSILDPALFHEDMDSQGLSRKPPPLTLLIALAVVGGILGWSVFHVRLIAFILYSAGSIWDRKIMKYID